MSRISTTYDEVSEVIQTLLSQGQRPTIARVREALGNRGSVALIARYMKTWKQANANTMSMELLEPEAEAPGPAQVFVEGNSWMQQPSAEIFAQSDISRVSEPPSSIADNSSLTSPREEVVNVPVSEQTVSVSHNVNTLDAPVSVSLGGAVEDNFESLSPVLPEKFTEKPYPDFPENVKSFLDSPRPESVRLDSNSLEALELLDKEDLIHRVRRLQSLLEKEQLRSESAEKISREALGYAENVKSRVAERIHVVRAEMQEAVNQLKTEFKEYKGRVEKEQLQYREQLEKANQKLMSLLL